MVLAGLLSGGCGIYYLPLRHLTLNIKSILRAIALDLTGLAIKWLLLLGSAGKTALFAFKHMRRGLFGGCGYRGTVAL
jgi:hypothetical protein